MREADTGAMDMGRASDPEPSAHTPHRAFTWTYRVAQNPRLIGPLGTFTLITVVVVSLRLYLEDPEDYSSLMLAVSFSCLTPPSLILAGFSHLRLGPRLVDEIKRVPKRSPWIYHFPLWIGLAALGAAAILDFERPVGGEVLEVWAIWAVPVIGCVALFIACASPVLRVHRCGLVFTPDTLEYTGPRFHASIPWNVVTALKPVGDANSTIGGLGRVDEPSSHHCRAGVQLTVRDGVDIRGRYRLFQVDGQDVIGVDCSSYRIDSNTLINAIYLLAENPELRPLAGTPAGADLFVGPTWNTRRKMRVGDQWDRTTGQILRSPVPVAS